jgi:DNA polymerase
MIIVGDYDAKQEMDFEDQESSLLNKMLCNTGFSQKDIYIVDIFKFLHQGSFKSTAEKSKICSDFLAQQINIKNPQLILAIGKYAGQFLLNVNQPLNAMRGQIHKYHDKPVLVSYHPAYLLDNPLDKKNAYIDLLKAQNIVAESKCVAV